MRTSPVNCPDCGVRVNAISREKCYICPKCNHRAPKGYWR